VTSFPKRQGTSFTLIKAFMRKLIFTLPLIMMLVPGCVFKTDESENDLSKIEYEINIGYMNAEMLPYISRENLYITYPGKPLALRIEFQLTAAPEIEIITFKLLEFPDTVNIDDWVRYVHADFINEYTTVKPLNEYEGTCNFDYVINFESPINNDYTERAQIRVTEYNFNAEISDATFTDTHWIMSNVKIDSLSVYSKS
jgi:hypothetical protein